jgi:3-hydroxyisobutyrate dehydrogenase-like beta-hydroxyacid dehydrogenase
MMAIRRDGEPKEGLAPFRFRRMRVAVLHPGEMGAAVAACLGQGVIWAPEGRSAETAERARDLAPGEPLSADVILSICPPHAAREVAASVAGFRGIYVDANAISPARVRQVRALVPEADFVDGGIIGPPPERAGTTRLYLTGERAQEVAALFAGSVVEARIVGDASALKMAYAAWTKGSAALLLAAHAAAEVYGVGEALDAEWSDLQGRYAGAREAAMKKGWRWAGEMEEIADAFAAAGQPEGFHRAAAEVYRGNVARRDDS